MAVQPPVTSAPVQFVPMPLPLQSPVMPMPVMPIPVVPDWHSGLPFHAAPYGPMMPLPSPHFFWSQPAAVPQWMWQQPAAEAGSAPARSAAPAAPASAEAAARPSPANDSPPRPAAAAELHVAHAPDPLTAEIDEVRERLHAFGETLRELHRTRASRRIG